MLQLFQAEWCPHSRKVRQRLTELHVDFVARQVEPEPEDRDRLREVAGADSIPVLLTEGGETLCGTEQIFDWLDETFDEPPSASLHREQAAEKASA